MAAKTQDESGYNTRSPEWAQHGRLAERSPRFGRRVWAVALLAAAAGTAAWELYTFVGAVGHGQALARAEPDVPVQPVAATTVTALGRIEPRGGIIHIAGPSQPVVVISKLLVAEGDLVRAGQVVAVLDSFAACEATVTQFRAELKNHQTEYQRYDKLYQEGVASASERDTWRLRVEVTQAALQRAQAELDAALVRAPIDGRVLQIYAHRGEKVGPEGIARLGNTDQMDVHSEVYETDIARVQVGQRAKITSAALSGPLYGIVERIGLQVGKLQIVTVDPAADTDARVVDVHIRLEDSERVAALSNLQVEVSIAF